MRVANQIGVPPQSSQVPFKILTGKIHFPRDSSIATVRRPAAACWHGLQTGRKPVDRDMLRSQHNFKF